MNQRELVERAKRGNHDAFAALATAAVGRVVGTSNLILRDPELARDAAQDTLVRAWRTLPSLRDPDRFDAWLHRLTVHACLDLLRTKRRRPTEVQLAGIDVPRGGDDPESVADRDQLDAALRRLTPEDRTAVVLRYYADLSVPEIAAAMRIPLGTAKSRLHRALSAMRLTMEQDRSASLDQVREGARA